MSKTSIATAVLCAQLALSGLPAQAQAVGNPAQLLQELRQLTQQPGGMQQLQETLKQPGGFEKLQKQLQEKKDAKNFDLDKLVKQLEEPATGNSMPSSGGQGAAGPALRHFSTEELRKMIEEEEKKMSGGYSSPVSREQMDKFKSLLEAYQQSGSGDEKLSVDQLKEMWQHPPTQNAPPANPAPVVDFGSHAKAAQ